MTNTFTLHFRISKSAPMWQKLVGAFPTASSSFSSLIEPQFLEGLHPPPHIPPSWNSTARNSGMLCSFLALGYAKWKGKVSFVDGSYQEVIHPSIDFYSSEDALSVTGPSDPPFTFGLPCLRLRWSILSTLGGHCTLVPPGELLEPYRCPHAPSLFQWDLCIHVFKFPQATVTCYPQ